MEASFIASLPNKKVALIGLSYKKSKLLFDNIWQIMVLPNKNDVVKSSEKDQFIKFRWGSTIEGLSADNPDSLVGDEYDLAILDEAAKMKPEIWDMYVSPAVGRRNGKAVFITTPQGFNWIHDKYILGRQDPMWESHTAPAWENTFAYPQGKKTSVILERKRNMSKEIFDQEYGAKFTSFEGMVYPFDRNKDVGKYPYNPDWDTYCSIDFGYRMPAVGWFQCYRVEGEWHINMIDEIVHESTIKTEELIRRIKARPYNIIQYFGDPAGKQRQGQSGMGDIEVFRQHGIRVDTITDKLSKNKPSGENHVRSFIENADGVRRLHIHEKCTEIQEDLEFLRYDKSGEKSIKDDYHDHACDMLRYFFINKFPMKNRKVKLRGR
tara:strand:+ start:195 stop:1331 length:1137 start_codon:yes stop_codon:yes gene_type:complete